MKIQVNSDKTINVDARLTSFVEVEASRLLSRFSARLTRVEVHLSDVDNKKTSQPDKRCLIEVRPAGERPMTATAIATTTEFAVGEALKKLQRSLTTFFGRKGRPAVDVSAPVSTPKRKAPATKPAPGSKQVASAKSAKGKKAAAKKPAKLNPRGPKKKGIYQARRKSTSAR